MKVSFHNNAWLQLAILILVTAAIYTPGLSGEFFFDDQPNILGNPALHVFDGSLSSLIDASTGGVASTIGRPFSMASFAMNLHFFGTSPFSFKVINLLVHLANGVLVFLVMRQLIPLLTREPHAPSTAIWSSALWLLHPINLVPVLFVTQRMTSLAALFTLSAILLYVYGRQRDGWKRQTAIIVSLMGCWPIAILSKETALLLPLLLLIIEWLALDSLRTISRKLLLYSAGILTVIAIGILVANWDFLVSGYSFRDFGLRERLLTEAKVLWFYLLQLFLPWPDFFSLHHDDFPISKTLLASPQTLLAIIGWISLVSLAFLKRHQWPLFSFAVFWFLAAHALESTIIPLEIAYEHRNYLASLGMLMWFSSLLFSQAEGDQGAIPRITLGICFVLFCGLVTTLRASQWGDEYLRTQLAAKIHPDSARANYEAGVTTMEKTILSENGGNEFAHHAAQFFFSRAAELDQDDKAALIGLLYLDCVAGKKKNTGIESKLQERFSTRPFRPGDQGVIGSLSEILVENRLCLNEADTQKLLEAALSNPHADGKIRGMLYAVAMDYALASMGSLPLALHYAEASVDSNPGSAALRINFIRLLLASGNKQEARREYTALLGLPLSPHNRTTATVLEKQLTD